MAAICFAINIRVLTALRIAQAIVNAKKNMGGPKQKIVPIVAVGFVNITKAPTVIQIAQTMPPAIRAAADLVVAVQPLQKLQLQPIKNAQL
jgi:hypothetical protein